VTAQNWQVYALASAFFAGLTAILAKLGVRDVDSNLATAIRTVVILVLAWGIVAAQGSYKVLPSLSGRTLIFLTLSGLATGASWLCYFHALKLGPASRVAPIDKLSGVFVIVLAALFLHEPLTWRVALGAGLIVSGAVLLIR
jgi:transporter family protein